MTPALRLILHDLAQWCGGFIIRNSDGEIESVWTWDYEAKKPRRVG
jgi:hypothetical protein